MNKDEIYAAHLQAEAEVDRLRRKLERQQRLFEPLSDDDPRRDQIINETCRLLEKYHAAEDEAQLWAEMLERP